jgi:diaminohydroxyphosphoribosylaminopyrimidine deaminase / 5-amino-6-(5-phosphoribosylamino)uracil reductase
MEDQFMERAIELAKKGIGHTRPNPTVGAVVVKNGKIIGEGWHTGEGKEHAEVVACRSVKDKSLLKGATLYITLEPCCHYGKTPPCTDTIIQYKLDKVVSGMKDPFKRVNGKGYKILRDEGVSVEEMPEDHSLASEVRKLNQPFIKWTQTALPYVSLKAGISLDGRIATRNRESKWITSERARKDARIERSKADAVLVGSGTIIADDPELAAHGEYSGKVLLRIILDATLSCPTTAKVFRDEHVVVYCSEVATKERRAEFADAGIRVEVLGQKHVPIKKLLQELGKQYIQHIYVEGGASVHGGFFDDAIHDSLVVDHVLFYVSPKIIGGKNSMSVIGGDGISTLDQAITCKELETTMLGDNIKIEGRINQY